MVTFSNYLGKILTDGISAALHLVNRLCKKTNVLKYKDVLTFLILFMLLWLWIILGAVEAANAHYINISYIDAIYFYFVTYSTIGYGDIVSPFWTTDQRFGSFRIYFGLAMLSGVVESLLVLLKQMAKKDTQSTGLQNSKCCICFCKNFHRKCPETQKEKTFSLQTEVLSLEGLHDDWNRNLNCKIKYRTL